MQVFRATNPAAAAMLDGQLIETSAEWYRDMMKTAPDNVCVVIVEDKGSIVGHIAARVMNDVVEGKTYAWLDSAYCSDGVDNAYRGDALNVLLDWCRDKNLSQIRAEVKRGDRALEKLYDFKEYAKVIIKEVNDVS